ncbi:MAG: universal stress protein [Maribacter sp.]|uniref:universal stress protein n=1 Tax=Maribacter sp. TaxID=1897614 RepID=UPI003C7271D5
MPAEIHPFKTILFGFAYSPSLKVNVLETARIAHFLNAKLILLHVGDKTVDKLTKINEIISEIEHKHLAIDIIWRTGKPYDIIFDTCVRNHIDLLILGARQHENMFQFYVGSIARKLTRRVSCSVLLLIKPSAVRVPCKHVVVNGLNAPDTPLAIADAFYMANALGSQQLTIVEEIGQKELHVTVQDDRTLKKVNLVKERLKHREESRVRKIIAELPSTLTGSVKVKTQSIFGKRGYSIGHYAEVVRADLLVMNAPTKIGLLSRIFPHDLEHILADLPTDLLIIRR